MGMNLDDIKYFQKICETKNITRASEILGITQPTLSYSLKRLESEVGDELIVRKKTGVELTKLGEEFLDRTHRLIFEWEKLHGLVTSDGADARGEYKIGAHPSVAQYSFGPLFTKIGKEFPLLDFTLVHGLSREITEKVINWELDFGIVVNPIKHPDLVIKELCKDVVTVFFRKGAAKRLIFDPDLHQSQSILKKMIKDNDFEMGQMTSSNLDVMAMLVEQKLGYAILPSRVAARVKDLIRLKNAPEFHDRICLVYRPEKMKSKIGKKMLKEIKEIDF